MLSFLLTIYLAFAYNPYVRSLRKPHQGPRQMAMMYGKDFSDFMEDYAEMAPFFSGAFSGMSGGNSNAGSNKSPWAMAFTPYLNNPMGLDMASCMDSDPCSNWVTSQLYGSFNSRPSQTNTDGGAASSGSSDSGASSDAGGSSDAGSSSQSGSGAGRGAAFWNPAAVGFPVGFYPSRYGLDYDALPIDCMDDSVCARALMYYTTGQSMGGSVGNLVSQFFPSRLQRPRRLSRPRYGVPFRYGRHY